MPKDSTKKDETESKAAANDAAEAEAKVDPKRLTVEQRLSRLEDLVGVKEGQ
jgi:hypothetical protein